MKAICQNCLTAVEFRNQRGNKLTEISCTSCGLRMLTRASFYKHMPNLLNPGEWVCIYKAKNKLYKLDKENNKFTFWSW